MQSPKILAINPGSTSTKVALFLGDIQVKSQSLHHDVEELRTRRLVDQLPMRWTKIQQFLGNEGDLDAVVGRGGLLHPLESGACLVNDDMLSDLQESRYGEHASNLGAFLAHRVAQAYHTRLGAIVVDPVVVDELDDVVRLTGHPELTRRSVFHALNQKAVARRVCRSINKDYSLACLVVAHMGGGVTVGAHRRGRVVDVNNGIDGEGPMTPERSGELPVLGLIDMCFSGLSLDKISRLLIGGGGFVAHLGSNDFRSISESARTDEHAASIVDAFAYQVAKEIGRAVATLDGIVDAIVLTGGLAHSEWLCSQISARVDKMARVIVVPGEDEMLALAEGALRVLSGDEPARTYRREHMPT